ncbi:MAG: nucleoside hydrolase [Bacteroidales bacterium]|nr:nucleoside hydrolase [Bacteroidales bacterium]
MKHPFLILVLIFAVTSAWSQPLPAKINHTIIIDTDGAIDDMRAISYLLSRPEITVKAVLVSDGSLPPEEGAQKVASLLNEFDAESIPVAPGPALKGINPPWRQFNRQIKWGTDPHIKPSETNAKTCLTDCLRNSKEKIILVCLGPLTNIAAIINNDVKMLSQIERIIWYTESVKPLKGFNYECDRESADIVFKSGLRIDVISNLGKSDALFDQELYNVCSQSKTRLATAIFTVHSQKAVMEKLQQNHFRLSDDLVALYLTNPELFSINTMTDRLKVRYNKDYDLPGINEAISDMIKGSYAPGRNIVFSMFPVQRELFRYDVRPIIDSAIARYGMDEWKANVMTDEFHGHLGVFSIVGAKMGIRAREIFGAGPDMLDVVTYAGSKPPYSCLNDGLQVSTGATLGMGTIHLADDSIKKPAALFTFRGRSVRISLKQEYLDKVDSDINEGILKFGLMDDGYWKLIRHNALKYWLEWDRNKIFDVEEVNKQ